MGESCKLVMVEWEDSCRPVPEWQYLEPINDAQPNICVSVGWLIHDGQAVKILAPNMANLDDRDSLQVSGVIRIPARSVLNMTVLPEEPDLISSVGPSSHLERAPMRQAT